MDWDELWKHADVYPTKSYIGGGGAGNNGAYRVFSDWPIEKCVARIRELNGDILKIKLNNCPLEQIIREL